MLKITENYKIYFVISAVLLVASIGLFIVWGVSLGIDFRGGSLNELKFEQDIDIESIRSALENEGLNEIVLQPSGERKVIIKTTPLTLEEQTSVKQRLTEAVGEFEQLRFESIGPTIGRELLTRSYWQIGLVLLGIILYIAYAFRKINKDSKHKVVSPWRLGMATIVALFHDLIITLGVFVILGKFFAVEIDSLFITALLTILGFSVHDSIVVFDRIRENLKRHPHKDLSTIIDYSVNSTLARSINTSSTLIFVLLALLLFGGPTIFYFVLALLVGVISGTYSSIFIASPLLYLWQKR